ncbi:protein phosphatase 1, regulatory (inhibitor) subunit 14Ba isoform X1 [Alosa alosa]|uniref:protein phosphatase 1, regulatory (inhibitor) subunit 14Ba isoform X1 n=1 Tax=Alosa alosa TaxID=278164 RepID=UPI00201523F3|nr:protein phosphatase 1, regulatory (inhibitor) subunit 14Ba isoform X1 [Alosa alosa]
MAAVTSPETTPQPRVYFQTPPGTGDEVPQKQGRVTVKYDRKELRKRLNLEEWIVGQLTQLYDCEEEEVPELEIDVDELLDLPSDVDRARKVKGLLADCFKPTDASSVNQEGCFLSPPCRPLQDFVAALLERVRGMQKLSTPQKKGEVTP